MERKTTFLREILRPWWVRIAFLLTVAIPSYDGISNQFDWPKIPELLGMTGSLLPWWGWLIVILAISVGALFDYVRRNVPIQPQKPISRNDISKIHVDKATKEAVQEIQKRIDELAEKTEGFKSSIENQKWAILAIYHRERMLALASKIDQLGDEVGLRNNLSQSFDEREFEDWESRFLEWRTMVGQWSRYASFYTEHDPQNDIEHLTERGLREDWGVKSDQFPGEGITQYKAFRIYLRNWTSVRDLMHHKVRQQAFEGQQTNTRQHYGI